MFGTDLDWPVVTGVVILAGIVLADTTGLVLERVRDRRSNR